MCVKFQLFKLMVFSSVFDSCWQPLKDDDNWYRKSWTGCFIHTHKVICIQNFSSPGWFSFSSAVFSCWQLLRALTADMKTLIWNFHVYTKAHIVVPNLSSLSWFSFSSTFISCHQLLTTHMKKKFTGTFMDTLKSILVPNSSSLGQL